MALLLLAAAAVSGLALGETVDAVAIATIVIVNAVIALVQEGRAERALEVLESVEAPVATVVRDGRTAQIDAREVVPGDVLVVQAGDRVPADVDLLESSGLEVDEAILTGESLPTSKHAGAHVGPEVPVGDRAGRLHSGTLVTRGVGAGRVRATGANTELGAIARQLREVRREPTPLQRQLSGLTGRLGTAAVVIAGATFAVLLVRLDGDVDAAFLTAVALAVAAVPEGLAAVTTVALALGVARMARRGAIVRRLPAVETLGTTDVLLTDKTGTVTQNLMQLNVVVTVDGRVWERDEVPAAVRDRLEPVAVLCNDATVLPPAGDPTERALLDLADADRVDAYRGAHPRRATAPFTADRRRMGSVHEVDGTPVLLVKGAPESVLPLCTTGVDDDGLGVLTAADRERLAALADTRASRGERVLALASRPLARVPSDGHVEEHEAELSLLALVCLRDPPRDSASASVAAIRAAGITLVMVTGDHPSTARAVATEVGLASGAPVTGADLHRDGIPADPSATPVYARVDPGQKLALVERLQAEGHTVAMTGDGVNDAPALRRADIGVALGATGSDVAREAADLVITDDDLATIVAAVREGRGIYDNLRKVIDYLVASNLAEVVAVIATLVLVPEIGVPLFPLQLLWINLLTDGLPALALGVDPVDPGLMAQPPRSATQRLLDLPHLRRLVGRAVVLASGPVGALLIAQRGLDLEVTAARTVLFSAVMLAQVLYALVVRHPRGRTGAPARNRWLLLAIVGSIAAHVLILLVPPAQDLFHTARPDAAGWWLILGGGTVAPGVLALALWRRSLAPSPARSA